MFLPSKNLPFVPSKYLLLTYVPPPPAVPPHCDCAVKQAASAPSPFFLFRSSPWPKDNYPFLPNSTFFPDQLESIILSRWFPFFFHLAIFSACPTQPPAPCYTFRFTYSFLFFSPHFSGLFFPGCSRGLSFASHVVWNRTTLVLFFALESPPIA